MLKLLAFLMIVISLGLGSVTATTAYRWSLAFEDAEFQLDPTLPRELVPEDGYVQLKANAGGAPASRENADGTPPVARASTLAEPSYLNPATLSALREAGVSAVQVKTFRFGNWEHRFSFIASVVGLIAGGLLMRLATKPAERSADDSARATASPGDTLNSMIDEVDTLITGLRGLGDDALRCDAIVRQLGETLQTHAVAFVDARDELVARMGLGRYARLMDQFAGAERTLNRAWSAAADGVDSEAMDCLSSGLSQLREVAALHDELTGRDAA